MEFLSHYHSLRHTNLLFFLLFYISILTSVTHLLNEQYDTIFSLLLTHSLCVCVFVCYLNSDCNIDAINWDFSRGVEPKTKNENDTYSMNGKCGILFSKVVDFELFHKDVASSKKISFESKKFLTTKKIVKLLHSKYISLNFLVDLKKIIHRTRNFEKKM